MQLKEALSGVTGGPLGLLGLEEVALVGWGLGPGSTRSLKAFCGNRAQAWDLYSQRGLWQEWVSSPGTPAGLLGPEQMGDPIWRGVWAYIGVCSYCCTRRPGWQTGRSATMVAPRFVYHCTMVPHLRGVLELLHQPPWWRSPSPTTTQQLSSLWVHSPNPPSPHKEAHNWGWSAQGCDMYNAHRFHTILPSIAWPLHSPLIPQFPGGPSHACWFPQPWAEFLEYGSLSSPQLPTMGTDSLLSSVFIPHLSLFPSHALLGCGEPPPIPLGMGSPPSMPIRHIKNCSNCTPDVPVHPPPLLFSVELWEFFMYSGHQFFIIFVFTNIFLSICALYFHFLESMFEE